MTALAKTRPIDYKRLSMSALRDVSRQAHPEHSDEATREYVRRLIDLELERRLDILHRRPGWHPHSPGFGDSEGRGTAPVDAMFMAYERGIPNSYWHDVAKRLLGTLSPRKLMAVLIQAAKADSRLDGPWCATHDQIAANLGHYGRMLGWGGVSPVATHTFKCFEEREVPREVLGRDETEAVKRTKRYATEHKVPVYKNGQALKYAAYEGRIELILQVKAGV